MLLAVNEEATLQAGKPKGPVFVRVSENLYRLESSGGYYALLKRGDKQFRRSLRTKDRKLAERRLAELRQRVGGLAIGDEGKTTFDELADRWMKVTSHTLKPSSVKRRWDCIKNLTPFFAGLTVRNVQRQHCERWLTERGPMLAAMTMNRELELMRSIFGYGVKLGLLLKNPAEDIERRRVVHQQMQIPTREQFRKLVETIRISDGRKDNQAKARHGANLVELLAYSGCRLSEATALRWRDVDFDKNTLTITGGEGGTKNHESRVIPMTQALVSLLGTLYGLDNPASDDEPISKTANAKKCLATACRRLSYTQFTHHDFRHFFATSCIESGVDIPTVSRWLGHKDGGALAMRVYGHLRNEHSVEAAKRVAFI